MDSSILNWLITGFGILANLVITTVVTTSIKRWFDKKDAAERKREEEKAKKEAEHQKELERLAQLEEERKAEALRCMMDQRCAAQVQAVKDAFASMNEHLARLEGALLSDLRNDLTNNFYRCRDTQKYRTDWDTQNMESLYKSYDSLHGNSYIHHLMDDFYKIPLM